VPIEPFAVCTSGRLSVDEDAGLLDEELVPPAEFDVELPLLPHPAATSAIPASSPIAPSLRGLQLLMRFSYACGSP